MTASSGPDHASARPAADPRIAAARGGDEDALGGLLGDQVAALTARIRAQIPDRVRSFLDAEDIVQETFTDAFLAIGRFEPHEATGGDDAFAAWLWSLARHNLVDAIRLVDAAKRGGGRRNVTMRDPEASVAQLGEMLLASSITSPSRAAMRGEHAAVVREAIAELPEPHRTVVDGYDLRGRPVEDLASELSRSVGAIYLLRNRAHRQLRRRLLAGEREKPEDA